MPGHSMAEAERWAAAIPGSAYAIDDQTAITVTDGTVEVVSEGHWKLFTPSP
jgi:dipeptidase E